MAEPTRQLRFKVGDRVYARANHAHGSSDSAPTLVSRG